MNFLYALLTSGLLFGKTPVIPNNVPVEITIENIKNTNGSIEIGVFNTASTFLKEGKQYKSFSKKVTGNTVSITIHLEKDGEYAFAIYQDINSDKICNKNFIGIPKEPYGFSKVWKSIYSKPKFKNCKINTEKERKIKIKLL